MNDLDEIELRLADARRAYVDAPGLVDAVQAAPVGSPAYVTALIALHAKVASQQLPTDMRREKIAKDPESGLWFTSYVNDFGDLGYIYEMPPTAEGHGRQTVFVKPNPSRQLMRDLNGIKL